jgi:hypothetical protein
MNKGINIAIIIISSMLIIIGCTDKKNLTGTSGLEGPIPIEIEISSDMFTDFYSYEDSIRNFNSDNLMLGNYESNNFNNQAVTLLKFTSLVDSFDQVVDVKLNIRIKENYNFDVIDNTTLKIGKMKIDWLESSATWYKPADDTTWTDTEFSLTDGIDFEFLDDIEISTEGDSLIIELSEELLQNWILADSLNYGLALFTEDDDKFIEFYSSEYSDENGPKLYFDYTAAPEDTLETLYRTPTNDIHIYKTDNDFTVYEDKLIISNIQPIKMFLKFDILNSIFIGSPLNSVEDTLAYLERLTINRADLVLAYESDNPYPEDLNASINIDPFIMISPDLNLENSSIPMINSEDYEDMYITSSNDSLNSDAFTINITRIMQAIISDEDYDNCGIMLKSIYENKDFKHSEFNLEPKITILFTPPISEE